MNIQKSTAFPCTKDKYTEKEIWETILFTINKTQTNKLGERTLQLTL